MRVYPARRCRDRPSSEKRPRSRLRQFRDPVSAGFPDHGAGAGHHPGNHRFHAQARREGNPRLRREARPEASACRSVGKDEQAPTRRPAKAQSCIIRETNMQGFFTFLQQNPYLLLFFVVGLAVWIGRGNIKGYGLGMVAGAIIVGAGLSVWASVYGVKLELNNFAKSLFYYLFMYGVGLRVGPSFVNSLKGDGLTFTLLALISSVLGLGLVVIGAKMFDLPAGAAGGLLAGSQTMSAAIGSAEQAVTQGAVKLADGTTAEQVSAIIALSYGISYIWGTVGIILICKYLPKWWGLDAKAAAIAYEREHGVRNVDDVGLTGYRPFAMRAYKLENAAWAGKSIQDFRNQYPEYRVLNVRRGQELLGSDPGLKVMSGDVLALAGTRGDMATNL